VLVYADDLRMGAIARQSAATSPSARQTSPSVSCDQPVSDQPVSEKKARPSVRFDT